LLIDHGDQGSYKKFSRNDFQFLLLDRISKGEVTAQSDGATQHDGAAQHDGALVTTAVLKAMERLKVRRLMYNSTELLKTFVVPNATGPVKA
jgi:hypothetical protein